MNKKKCEPGAYYDILINKCFRTKTDTSVKPGPTGSTAMVQLKTTPRTLNTSTMTVLSPALCTIVVLATLGSILVLAIWCVIYRRQTRGTRSPVGGDAEEQQQEPLQKAEPPLLIRSLPSKGISHADMFQRAAEAPSPCPHLHPGAQTSFQWQEDISTNRETAKHACTEGGRGLPSYNTVQEHRIPLPATELGGTALVTTKTM